MAYGMAEAAIEKEREKEREKENARTGGGAHARVAAPYVPPRDRGVDAAGRWHGRKR